MTDLENVCSSFNLEGFKEDSSERRYHNQGYNKGFVAGKKEDLDEKSCLVAGVAECMVKEPSNSTQSNEDPLLDSSKMNVDTSETVSKEEPLKSPIAEIIVNLRSSIKTPLENIKDTFTPKIPEEPTMKQSLLLEIIKAKQGSKLGKALHGESWKKNVKWMKQELGALIELNKDFKQEDVKVVPKVRYWGTGDYTEESKEIANKLRQMMEENNRRKLEIAQKERHLAERKMQVVKAELKAKVVDMKVARSITYSI